MSMSTTDNVKEKQVLNQHNSTEGQESARPLQASPTKPEALDMPGFSRHRCRKRVLPTEDPWVNRHFARGKRSAWGSSTEAPHTYGAGVRKGGRLRQNLSWGGPELVQRSLGSLSGKFPSLAGRKWNQLLRHKGNRKLTATSGIFNLRN